MSLMCGGGGGGDELTPAERAAHKAIAKASQENADREAKIIKMLLLGAGESGKSTIFKQMKIINKDGYTDKEKKDFISIIHSNVITAIKVMFQAFGKLQEEMSYEVSQIMEKCEADAGYHSEELTAPLAELIKKAWATNPFMAVFSRRSEFQLNDSAECARSPTPQLRARSLPGRAAAPAAPPPAPARVRPGRSPRSPSCGALRPHRPPLPRPDPPSRMRPAGIFSTWLRGWVSQDTCPRPTTSCARACARRASCSRTS